MQRSTPLAPQAPEKLQSPPPNTEIKSTAKSKQSLNEQKDPQI